MKSAPGLTLYVREIAAPVGVKQSLLVPLLAAQDACKNDRPVLGNIQLETFKIAVQVARP
ncbi:hypothetical protein [Edaphobacter modestus]|uniref:Uncharacterized protein n=1 Tax=Edaphobacter modestus TaxID=388466 RepID=A0A4Q7YS34_9BACT|nr:hypothetical protein [Edaphobacter modestus]RZU39771.1 hypothetical protein BDD14_1164 [Edaphobacter modestus]